VPSRSNATVLRVLLALDAVACVALSFAPYYSYALNGGGNIAGTSLCQTTDIKLKVSGGLCNGASTNAWHGILGWLGIALAVVGAAIGLAVLARPVIGAAVGWAIVGAFGLAAVLELVSIGVVPDGNFTARITDFGLDESVHIPAKDVDAAPAWGLWVVIVLVIVGFVGSVLLARPLAAPSTPSGQQYAPQQYAPQQYAPQQYAPQPYPPQQYPTEQYPGWSGPHGPHPQPEYPPPGYQGPPPAQSPPWPGSYGGS
jgi:hypothetical protein